MRKIFTGLMVASALVLGACGAGPTVNDAANQAGTAVADPTNQAAAADAANQAATAVLDPTNQAEVGQAADAAGTQIANPTTSAAINEAATAVTGPDAATAVSEASGALSAVADNVTVQQGQALVLDATKSAGDISNYKWTIVNTPAGADSVKGQVITENSNGNVSIDPADYAKYFPTAGDYTVQLTVTDSSGGTSNNDFMITVP